MEAFRRQVSGTGAKKKKPEPVTRDAYGFVVKPEHVDAYRRNAPMYVTEETERAERWDAFLSQSREEVADASSISGDVNTNGNSASGASASTSGDAFGRRTLDAVVRVLEARAVRGAEGCRVAGAETSRTIPDEERELNALVAGGVPMALRGKCWQIFARVDERRRDGHFRRLLIDAGEIKPDEDAPEDVLEAVDSVMASLVDGCVDEDPIPDPHSFRRVRKQIDKDLPRTFPGHPLLDGIGRDSLRRVLVAYARHNPAVGYCQGMNFIAALLLLMMEEEPAFWCLGALVEDILPGYYSNTMLASAVDQAVLRSIVDERFPRVGQALEDSGTPLAAVSASWFLTLYVNQLPWECCLRVWDVLLFERTRRILFQAALALIDVNAKRMVEAQRLDRLMELATQMAPAQFDGSELLMVATAQFTDVTWGKIMDLYKEKHAELTSMGVDGTVNGRNNLDKSVSASPSSQLATVGSGKVGGGEGGLWVGANGGGNGSGRFPPTPMQDGWAGEVDDSSDEETERTAVRRAGGAEGVPTTGTGVPTVVDDWFAVKAGRVVGGETGREKNDSNGADGSSSSSASASASAPSSSSYSSYMKGIGRSFKGLYSSSSGKDGKDDSSSKRSKNLRQGTSSSGLMAPRPDPPPVRVILAYTDTGKPSASWRTVNMLNDVEHVHVQHVAERMKAEDTINALRCELEAASMQRDAAKDAMEQLAARLADQTQLAAARERQLEVMSGVLAIHRDECAVKDAEAGALREENVSLRELVERLSEPPGSVLKPVRFPEGSNGGDDDDAHHAPHAPIAGVMMEEEENWAARGGFATPEPAR